MTNGSGARDTGSTARHADAAQARSRLVAGTWIARILAAIYSFGAILLLVLPGPEMPRWPASIMLGLLAVAAFIAASFLARGSRIAAGALLAVAAVGLASSLRGGRITLLSVVLHLAAAAAFANALRGAMALAELRREDDAEGRRTE